MAGVSAIIPNWNRGELLERVLRDLAAQTQPPEEVVVVDNGSSDDSVARARRLGARAIELGTNTGFARAVNQGIVECRSPWVAIVNNDVHLPPEWLERLHSAADGTEAWFATGKMLRMDAPEMLDGTFDAVCRGGCAWRCGSGRRDQSAFGQERTIWLTPFTAALFQKRLFLRVGLLDEQFGSYLEDVDFGLRCAAGGFHGRYVPEAVAYHHGSATRGRWHSATVRQISRNQVYLIAKHYPKRWWRRYGWPVAVSQGLWGLLALRHGRAWAYLAGKAEGVRGYRKLRAAEPPGAMDAVLSESESLLRQMQRRTGFDWYWRLYFLLT
ncbi:MAG: glycosyltransferase family 2 protein [Bryobacteraceae bacterium]|nr:glycosyltransferase family 2 protein [Bryobacteraceae bacterium]